MYVCVCVSEREREGERERGRGRERESNGQCSLYLGVKISKEWKTQNPKYF